MFANETKADTNAPSGGNQIVVSPMNITLDLGETGYANALVLDKEGNPVEGYEIQIIPRDGTRLSIESDSLITNMSGYINFSILGDQQEDTVITITDPPERHGRAGGVTSAHINVAIRDFIQNILPYFYGDMQLSLINPSEYVNYVKIQFHENSNRQIPPVVKRLEGREMMNIKLSEETGMTLGDGWVAITSTDVIFGGMWTNKGYLYFNRIDE